MSVLFIALLAASPELVDVDVVELKVAVVRDPELSRLEPELVRAALAHAQQQFEIRFGTRGARFVPAGELSLAQFFDRWADPNDPRCSALYQARYRGGGARELETRKKEAIQFFQKWSLESLAGFIDEKDRPSVRSHEDVWTRYVAHYTRTVDAMKGLKTDVGTPLVQPERSTMRSFAAWICALRRQSEFDVIITNAFILMDSMDEPHPHAVFGKAKIGGIATSSPRRAALGGQALLATTFGMDTKLREFREIPEGPITLEERAKILGAYLLAHEIAHAMFLIPDVFDHPKGCLMTSRPDVSYREGLAELEATPEPCPRCRPYVEARSLADRARRALEEKKYARAHDLVAASLRKLPKHVHGSRSKRVTELLAVAARASRGMRRTSQAMKYEELIAKLDSKGLTSALTSSTSTTTR